MRIALNKPQMNFMTSRKRHVLLCAGRGAGKTYVGALWALKQMVDHPGSVGLVGANVPRQLNNVVLRQLTRLMKEAGVGHCYGRKPPWPMPEEQASWTGILSIRNGSMAYCRSMHASGVDNNIRGLEVGWQWLDEARDLEKQSVEIALACLRGQEDASYEVRLTSTPNGMDWMYDRFVSGDVFPDSEIIQGRTLENKRNLPPDYEEVLRSTYSSRLAAQELDAEFVNMHAGSVYSFERDRHVDDSLAMDPALPLILSVDQNVSPMCGIIMQLDKKSRRAWVLEEVVIEDAATTREWGEAAMAAAARMGKPRETWFFCDPTSARRDTRGGESDFVILAEVLKGRMPNVRDRQDRRVRRVEDGVNAVNSLLDPADGEPRLKMRSSCKELISDLERLQYVPGTRKVDKSDLDRTHAADSLRYVIGQELPVGPSKPVSQYMGEI